MSNKMYEILTSIKMLAFLIEMLKISALMYDKIFKISNKNLEISIEILSLTEKYEC